MPPPPRRILRSEDAPDLLTLTWNLYFDPKQPTGLSFAEYPASVELTFSWGRELLPIHLGRHKGRPFAVGMTACAGIEIPFCDGKFARLPAGPPFRFDFGAGRGSLDVPTWRVRVRDAVLFVERQDPAPENTGSTWRPVTEIHFRTLRTFAERVVLFNLHGVAEQGFDCAHAGEKEYRCSGWYP